MFILRANESEPMLIGELGVPSTEGIYKEVDEKEVPKEYRIDKLAGAAVKKGSYLRSNTYGPTWGKYFEMVDKALDFEPINDIFEKINDKNIKHDWKQVSKILEETDNNSIYNITFNYDRFEDTFNMKVIRFLEENEIKVKDHTYKEFEYNFRGMYGFEVNIEFEGLNQEAVNIISEKYGNSKKRNIKVNINDLNKIVDKFEIKLLQDTIYSPCYFKKQRVNFEGKDSLGFLNLFNTMTFKEAAEIWGLCDSTLRRLVNSDKIKEGIDYRKSGSTWIITREAMKRVYGEPKNN